MIQSMELQRVSAYENHFAIGRISAHICQVTGEGYASSHTATIKFK